MNSLYEWLEIIKPYAERLGLNDGVVFLVAAASAAVGYVSAVMIHSRQIAAQREGNRRILQMERNELTEFMRYVQSIASTVDEKVDQHSTSLTSINRFLGKEQQPDPKVVLKAVKQLFEANLYLHEELTTAQQEIDTKQQQLEAYMAEARTDKLTGVPNRRAFDEAIHRLMSMRARRRGNLSLMLADIDHFKLFNDYHGHQVGDEMLRRVAGTFEESTRSSDIVCRYGGEEFAILLPRTKLSDAIKVAERTRVAIQSMKCQIGDAALQVTTSIGVIELRPDEEIADFIKRGDEALYAAKASGRNCIRCESVRPNASQQLDEVMAEVEQEIDAEAGSVCQ